MLKDISVMTIEEKVNYFKETVCDWNKLKVVLEPQEIIYEGYFGIRFKFNFFDMFSEHPKYMQIVSTILQETFFRLFNHIDQTADAFSYILSDEFRKRFDKK